MSMQSDDYREVLKALQVVLAERIAEAGPSDTAPLARQLADVAARLSALPSVEEKSKLDDLASRRAARRSDVPDDSAKKVKRRSRSS